MNKVYLGDSVYVMYEDGMIKLTTQNVYDATNEIYLEPEVWANLVKFVEAANPRKRHLCGGPNDSCDMNCMRPTGIERLRSVLKEIAEDRAESWCAGCKAWRKFSSASGSDYCLVCKKYQVLDDKEKFREIAREALEEKP